MGDADGIGGSVDSVMKGVEDKSRIIFSCGGGVVDGVSSEDIRTFVDAVRKIEK